jgi:hypothetical protein
VQFYIWVGFLTSLLTCVILTLRFSEIGAGDKEGEGTILRTAYAYEQTTEWHRRKPKI